MTDADSVAALRQLYETADRFTREVSAFRDDVVIPANNELRYAGHHLLQSINEQGVITNDDQLHKAKRHCERAMYDAAEAGIISATEAIRVFGQEYRDVVISSVVGAYPNVLLSAKQAQALIAKGRDGRESVLTHASEYMETFGRLREQVALLEVSRDELNSLVRRDQRDSRRFWLRTALALFGFALTLLGLVLSGAL